MMASSYDSRDHLTVAIEGTFDVAVARNRLRQLADRFELPTVLRARAAAAITTACEAALFKAQTHQSRIELAIHIIQDQARQGVKLEFHTPREDAANNQVNGQLERACDCLEIRRDGDQNLISMAIWAQDK
jgi:hypothetical protein